MSGQKFIKNATNGPILRSFSNLKFEVKQCYQTGHFQYDKNWWKMPKLKNSNTTFCVIFKQYKWYEKCRISKKCLEHQDGRLNIYSFSLYEPHDFLTNVFFLMTFYWNEEFTRRPFVKYVPYYYISFWFPAHNQNLPWSSHTGYPNKFGMG